ncbi:hypothetical protein [Streptomyces canus]|uniref:hypothetical protein n=1 Tax=Streptomyces canus TaxID=58343 RepID=UPI00386A29B9
MLEYGVIVSYETGRRWCVKFGRRYADSPRLYLWRAVDPDGKVLGILVQKRREGRGQVVFGRLLSYTP